MKFFDSATRHSSWLSIGLHFERSSARICRGIISAFTYGNPSRRSSLHSSDFRHSDASCQYIVSTNDNSCIQISQDHRELKFIFRKYHSKGIPPLHFEPNVIRLTAQRNRYIFQTGIHRYSMYSIYLFYSLATIIN